MCALFQRLRLISNPPQAPKNDMPLKFGMLGAARIGPDALIKPAKSHADVVVAAVASRDAKKAATYAKMHGIAKTYAGLDCYQRLIADPDIDVVYNPLPNGLHFEWTMRALAAGKHVLVEKPIADTPEEAKQIAALADAKGVVALEAIHYTFHPAAQRVKEIIASGELGKIKSIKAEFAVPKVPDGIIFLKDDVRFNFSLGGGCTMDMGVYPLSAIRYLTSAEPLSVTSASAIGHSADPTRIDRAMHATFAFPGDITGETFVDFGIPGWGPLGLFPRMLKAGVHIVLEGGEIEFFNFPLPHVFHTIKVRPRSGARRTEKAYRHKDGSGQDWWTTYRYQLEAFVDKVRERQPQAWPPAEEAATQLEWVQRIYEKAGMPLRPASSYKAA